MRRILVVLVAMTLVLAACQSADEQLSEQLAEQLDGVDDVDINTDTGEVSIETDDGSISIGGGEIPAGFPIPAPDGYEVQAVFTSDTEGSVSLTYPQDRFDELVTFYGDWTAEQPGDWATNTNTYNTADGQSVRNSSWFAETSSVTVFDCSGGQSADINMACVTLVSGE
ncbi:MAG: hypothetical protein ACR2N7_12490 [Acidimicrobiia bacterium]